MTMWLPAALFLLASYIPTTTAIYPDEVNHIDFHHSLLGIPTLDSTFFLRPSAASNASLLYTLSEDSILGAVNPRDGALVWRQNLARLARDDAAEGGFLRAIDGTNELVSATGKYVSAWTAFDGKLIWENRFGDSIVDLELLALEDATSGFSAATRDSIALFGGKNGVVRRLDGESGNVKWEFKDDSGDVPFQVSSSPTQIYYISLQSALLKGSKVKVTSLDPVTGRQTQQQILNSESDVTGPDSVLFVGANTAAPLIAWADKSLKTLKMNVIGSKQVNTVNIENTSGEEIQKINVQAPNKLNSLPHFLVLYETASSSWAEVYHIDLKSSSISKMYQLPRVQERSVFATSTKDANVYFTRITDSEMTVVSSASHGILGRWPLKAASPEGALHAVSEVVIKGDNVAVRSAAARQSGDWSLVRNGLTEWTRHEGLTGAMAASWAEEDEQEELAHQLEVEGHESLLKAYVHRVRRHIKDLEYLPDWLRALPKRVLTSFLTAEISNLDSFGVSKPVIVATANGRVYSLDSGNQGSVSWSVKAAESDGWNVTSIVTQPGSATVYVDDGSSVTVDVTSGTIVSRTPATTSIQSVVVIDGETPSTIGIKEDGTPVSSVDSTGFLVTLSNDGHALGWNANNNEVPVWQFAPSHGQKVISATARPAHDPVASIGKVLGSRAVLYKYLNPNLVLVTAAGEGIANFYLLDGVSGKVLHASTQTGVDTTQPIASAMSENWFAYSFWGDVTKQSDAKGYQLVVSELYESPIPNDRGPLGSTSNFSSIHGDNLPEPHVVSQSFIIPEPISHMAVTQTRQGITTKQLVCTLPESNAIVGIPRAALDPRRPVGRDPNANEMEEGLVKYAPALAFEGQWYLSHSREVAGIKHVIFSPTLLESTSLIFAYGGDIFSTRATPSQAFDVLGKSFSKLQLLLTVVALGVGVMILRPMVRKKQVSALWNS